MGERERKQGMCWCVVHVTRWIGTRQTNRANGGNNVKTTPTLSLSIITSHHHLPSTSHSPTSHLHRILIIIVIITNHRHHRHRWLPISSDSRLVVPRSFLHCSHRIL